uniref:THAP domain-containing protein 1 n=1 Tax=Astyanax mexicanus TaxID=7994 RepID=A0A3B1K5G7_ASTMX
LPNIKRKKPCSSRYNAEISFHKFPVDAAVRAKWLTKIRRDKFTPTVNTRVCGRHFQPETRSDCRMYGSAAREQRKQTKKSKSIQRDRRIARCNDITTKLSYMRRTDKNRHCISLNHC